MKRIITIIALLATALVANAQTKEIAALINKYQGQESFTSIKLPGTMIGLAEDLASKDLPADMMKNVDMVYILVREDADGEYLADVEKITKSMLEIMDINSGGEIVKMYMSKDDSAFVMVVCDDSEVVVMALNGKNISAEQMTALATATM